MQSINFNPAPSTILHIDINSCFASIEQQANPLLRGKPVVVAAYDSPGGCILAASIEAKRLGIKTGLRVREGKALCPSLIVLPTDLWKYRSVHLALRHLLSSYTDRITPKSIDEFVLDLSGTAAFQRGMLATGQEIKLRIKREIGDWLTVSIGIAPNRFLAKTASNLKKPDGLEQINYSNFHEVYSRLKLADLCGIKKANAARLSVLNIATVLDFYSAELWQLKAAFSSITGYYWYLRLRGWEIDQVEFGRRSYGNSYALPKPFSTENDLAPILQKLVEKMSFRMRQAGYSAKGVHLGILYRDRTYWHRGLTLPNYLFESREIYQEIVRLLRCSEIGKPVAQLAVSVFSLAKLDLLQADFFSDALKKKNLSTAVDAINKRWGNFVIAPATMFPAGNYVPDRIAFGGVKELEEFTFDN